MNGSAFNDSKISSMSALFNLFNLLLSLHHKNGITKGNVVSMMN